MTPEKDREHMALAVHLSTKSRAEDDGRIHPFVGAVIAHPEGHLISSGYRGQHTAGNHAEQEALIDIDESVVRGSVVYSTLEPCTSRGWQTPCCLRLLNAGVAEVVIGILDPNPDIRGRGEYKFEEQRIRVRKFDPNFVDQIRSLNADFIEYQLGLGLMFKEVQKIGADSIEVTQEHRTNRQRITVNTNNVTIRGTYRVKPMSGDRIVAFVKRHGIYYPQQSIDFNFDRQNSIWHLPYAWIAIGNQLEQPIINEIIIARLSEDLSIALKHYNRVHDINKEWIGFDLSPEPPGFERLASITIAGSRPSPSLL